MRVASSFGLIAVLLISFSVTAVVAMQDSSGGIRDGEESRFSALGQEPSAPPQQPALEDPNVVYVGVTSGVERTVPEQPLMIDVSLASIEVGPQAERCGKELVGKETLKALVRKHLLNNKASMTTQQVGENDVLTVMACIYPNDIYPGQAVLSVAVPQRFSEPVIIPVSEDCVRRVNEAIATGNDIPADCKPTAPPVDDPETLLVPVPLKEIGQ